MEYYEFSPIFERFIKEHKTPALFIGSGFSKRYLKNYLTWEELLVKLGNLLGKSEFNIRSMINNFQEQGLSKGDANSKVASILETSLNKEIQAGNADQFFSVIEQQEIIEKKYNHFRYLVCKCLPKDFQIKDDASYYRTELHLFSNLITKTPCIITTNYDSFLEHLFQNKFSTYIYQNDYVNTDSLSAGDIYKLHGSISDPNSIVITFEDYQTFENHAYLSTAKLISLVCSYPIIFLGYSLSDENIIKILSKIISCLSDLQINTIQNDLVFISWVLHKKSINQQNKKEFQVGNRTITMHYIETDNYTCVYQYINRFLPAVSPLEIKKYQKLIKKLLITQDKKLETIIGQALDLDKLPENTVIEGLAGTETAYAKHTINDLVLDVLYHHKLIPLMIFNKWFCQATGYNTNAPLYYYLKTCNNLSELSDTAKEKLLKYLEHKKHFKVKEMELFSNKSSLQSKVNKELKPANKLNLISYNYYEGRITRTECESMLKAIYDSDKTCLDSNEFKKAVMLLDYDKTQKI